MKDNTANTRNEDVTIGLDLGDRRCHACVLDAAGSVIEERTVATRKQAMATVFKEYEGCMVVMEVSTHSPWISRLLRGRGFRVRPSGSIGTKTLQFGVSGTTRPVEWAFPVRAPRALGRVATGRSDSLSN